MANAKEKKVVRINENDLVDLIENIVNESVAQKKKQWIAENQKKNKETLEETITKIVEAKLGKK